MFGSIDLDRELFFLEMTVIKVIRDTMAQGAGITTAVMKVAMGAMVAQTSS